MDMVTKQARKLDNPFYAHTQIQVYIKLLKLYIIYISISAHQAPIKIYSCGSTVHFEIHFIL